MIDVPLNRVHIVKVESITLRVPDDNAWELDTPQGLIILTARQMVNLITLCRMIDSVTQ